MVFKTDCLKNISKFNSLLLELLLSPSSCPLQHDIPVSRETKSWGKESDLIQKAGRLRSWWTNDLKQHQKFASFFDAQKMGSRRRSRLGVAKGCRHLGANEGPRGAEKLPVLG